MPPGQVIRVQQLLRVMGREEIGQADRLKTLLAPIIAKSEAEQTRFYETFEEWWKTQVVSLWQEEAGKEDPQQEPEILRKARRRWIWPAALAGVLALSLVLGYFLREDPPPTKPEVYFSLDKRCYQVGDTVSLQAATSDSTAELNWATAAGESLGSAVDTTYRLTKPGLLEISLTASKDGLDSTYRRSLFVAEGKIPQALIIAASRDSLNYTFNAGQIAPAWQYRWEFDGGETADGPIASRRLPAGEEHTIRLRVSLPEDSLGYCTANSTFLLDRKEELVALPKLAPLRLPPNPKAAEWRPYTWLGWPLLCVLLLAGYLAYRRYRRRPPAGPAMLRALRPGDGPPVELPFPEPENLPVGGELSELAAAMRQREYSERRDLDLPTTLRATIRSGGFPQFHYQRQDRPIEYLALVESSSERDQQARLFGQVLQLLQGEQVPIEVWYYHEEPSLCYRREGDEGVPLHRLAQLFGQHRLMIFGQGHGLLQRNGQLRVELASVLDLWEERALLTPTSVLDWSRREQQLREHFVLLPADLAGQMDLVEAWDERDPPEFRALQRRLLRARPEAESAFDYELDEIEDLRTYLGESRFRWLAALALWPRPVWELTLHLATGNRPLQATGFPPLEGDTGGGKGVKKQSSTPYTPASGGNLRSTANRGQPPAAFPYDDLLALTRLPFLQDGDLPSDLRQALLDQLDPETERDARRLLLDLLDSIEVPVNSHAAQEQEVQRDIHYAFLHPEDASAQAGLEVLLAQGLLDPATRSKVKARQAQQTEAENTHRQLSGVLAAAGMLLGFLLLWLNPPQGKYGGLARMETDSLAWYVNAAADSLEVGNLTAANESVKWLKAQEWGTGDTLLRGERALQTKLSDWVTALIQYEQGRSRYDQQVLDSAEFSFLQATLSLLQAGAIGIGYDAQLPLESWQTLQIEWADTIGQHLHHARGLSAFYQDSLGLATDIVSLLPDSFFQSFGTPNLRSLLVANDLASLKAIAEAEYKLVQAADGVLLDPAAALDEWRKTLALFEQVLERAPEDADALARSEEIKARIAELEDQLRAIGQVQEIPFTGSVTTSEGRLIEGASLLIDGQDLGFESQEDGSFSFTYTQIGEPKEQIILSVRVIGFQLWQDTLDLPLSGPIEVRLQAQEYASFEVSGTVVDQAGDPIPGVTLYANGQEVAVTDESGNFRFDYQPQNDVDTQFECVIQGPDYADWRKMIDLPLQEPLRITLKPEIPDLILPRMRRIPGGSFLMGSPEGEGRADERPEHPVTVSEFYLGETEVTVGQYLAFCQATDTHWPEWLEAGNDYHVETGTDSYYKDRGYTRTGSETLPIVGVSWHDAVAYAEWLSKETGQRYRLPSEAEWEYAAGGGTLERDSAGRRRYVYSGRDDLDAVGWYYSNSNSRPQAVRTKQPNALGLYDMSGNVWEWCADDWHDTYAGAPADGSTWGNGDGANRVIRGGSWSSVAGYCRVAYRIRLHPDGRSHDLGFRLARN